MESLTLIYATTIEKKIILFSRNDQIVIHIQFFALKHLKNDWNWKNFLFIESKKMELLIDKFKKMNHF